MSGKILHIDFGDCFEVAMHREKYPERIPFRLTRMLIKAMEVSHLSERASGRSSRRQCSAGARAGYARARTLLGCDKTTVPTCRAYRAATKTSEQL